MSAFEKGFSIKVSLELFEKERRPYPKEVWGLKMMPISEKSLVRQEISSV